ncbi:class I tRNA ligase family protein, partial [Campylobacter avium]|uniref:class I tRNA ligase family protein n=1 Tax=Campylobacter avium TaxID=522485 RepID=UPI00248C2420
KSELGKYILSRFNLCIKELRENLDTYRFNDAATVLYRFFWDEFCDFGIELSKAEKSSVAELGAIFKEALKALSVFMPFISEYLYHKLSGTSLENDESIMIKPYPKFSKRDEEAEKLFALIIESIVSIRRAKSLLELTKIKKAYIKLNDESLKHSLQKYKHFISLLSKSEDVDFVDTKMKDCSSDISVNLESFVPLEGLDLSAILNRLSSQESKLQKEKEKLSSMLSNENFVKNAPKELVLQNQKALESVNERLLKVQTELSNLRSLSD